MKVERALPAACGTGGGVRRGAGIGSARWRPFQSRAVDLKAVLLLCVFLLGGGLFAHAAATIMAEEPPSSPLWWTLTDRISPKELHKILRDPEGHLTRYLVALDRGLVGALPEDVVLSLTAFQHGELFPELVPFWNAFDTFAQELSTYGDLEHEFRRVALEYGLSPEGIETILFVSREHISSCEIELARALEVEERFERLLRRASGRGQTFSPDHLTDRDLTAVAAATGESREAVEQLYRKRNLGPRATVSFRQLKVLRASLSEADWDATRRYLLHEVAPRMSLIEIEMDEDTP